MHYSSHGCFYLTHSVCVCTCTYTYTYQNNRAMKNKSPSLDPVNSPSRGLEETSRTPPHHMAEHRTAGSEIPHLRLPEAMDMAQNRSLWRMWSTYGTTQS